MAYDMVGVMREAKKRRKEVLRLRKQGKTTQQIAALWGVTRQRVDQIIAAAKQENGA